MHCRKFYLAHLQLLDSGDFKPICKNLEGLNSNSIYICVRKQENMSKWLHECNINEDDFEITGPYVFCICNYKQKGLWITNAKGF